MPDCDPSATYERRYDPEWAKPVTQFEASVRDDQVALRGNCKHCCHQIDDVVLKERPKPLVAPDLKPSKRQLQRLLKWQVRRLKRFGTRVCRACRYVAGADDRDSRNGGPSASDITAPREAKVLEVAADEQTRSALEVVVACNCESKHEGRPEGKLGCGRYAAMAVDVHDSTADEPVVRLTPLPATASDKRWDEISDEVPFTTLASARSLAEKWAATVATLLSLLGIAAFFETKDELLKLDPIAKGLAGFAAALALAAGALATFAAARAAQGGLKKVTYLTGDVIRRVYRDAVDKLAELLWLSRLATIVALIFALLAVGLSLYGPQSDAVPASKLLVLINGEPQPLCGDLEPGVDGRVHLETGDGTNSIPLTEVAAITTVTTCPE